MLRSFRRLRLAARPGLPERFVNGGCVSVSSSGGVLMMVVGVWYVLFCNAVSTLSGELIGTFSLQLATVSFLIFEWRAVLLYRE